MSAESNRRLLSVTTPLGPDAFLLTGFSGTEGLSRLFRFELEMLSERDAVAAGELAGRPISWAVHSPGRPPRFFHGVVRRFVAAGREVGSLRTYRAVVVPWVWVLTRGAECRVYADRTLPEVVEAVFRAHGFTDYELALRRAYPRREHWVQYRESAIHFVSRLLEEEGVFTFFRHEESRRTLVLADHAGAYEDCLEGQPRYSPGVIGRDRISRWEHRFDISPGDWTPGDEGYAAPLGVGGNVPEVAAHHVFAGSGGCCTFTPGGKFALQGHGCESENRRYALVTVEHAASDPSFTPAGGGRFYENTFTCIPDSAAYRPPPAAPRPVVAGPQTAVVVGPKDGEPCAVEGGRVAVRFLWGRERTPDAETCRVRVAKGGPHGDDGAAFRARVGQEVLVDFLDRDPHRPLLAARSSQADPPAPTKPVEAGRPAAVPNDGRSVTEAAEAIELRVGPSVIKLEPTGITIQGMTVAVEGHAQAEVKGLMTRVSADAVLVVQGGATVIG